MPRLPANLDTSDLDDPYASYRAPDLYAFLAGHALARDPGAGWEYSNLGAGLLGHVLATKAGTSYEDLVRRRVLEPLGMTDTTITLSPDAATADGDGARRRLRPVSWWDFDALAGAGAIRSTASDMLTFAAAALGADTPLAPAFARMTTLRRPSGQPATQQLAGWVAVSAIGTELLAHDGGTHGFRSSLMVDVAHKRAALPGSTARTTSTISPVTPSSRASRCARVSPPRTAIAVDADDARAATWASIRSSPASRSSVSRDGTRLFVQATGQPRFEIYAEKRDAFFLTAVDAQLTFTRDASGAVTGLVLHQNGARQPAPKRP